MNPFQTTAILKIFIHVNNSEELTEITNWLLFLGKGYQGQESARRGLKSFIRDCSYISHEQLTGSVLI